MFTTLTTTKHSRHSARRRLIALTLAAAALAIPSSASAFYGSESGTAGPSGEGSASDGVPANSGLVTPDHTALNESLAPVGGSQGPRGVEQPPAAPVSSPPAASDKFDWADAALGAGIAMAAVTLGGVALLTLRRRTAVSRTA